MKHTLCLSALLMTTSVAALAAPVTYDFTGELNQVILSSINPLLPASPNPNSPLTDSGAQLLNGSPYVVGTITFDPDYTPQSGVPVPVAYSFTLEGFTITHTIAFSPFDTLTVSPTGMQAHLESNMQSTGALFAWSGDVDLNFSGGNVTGGSFNLHGLVDPSNDLLGGSLIGTISSVTPVGVPEPGEFALLVTGLAASIWVTMRRRVAIPVPN